VLRGRFRGHARDLPLPPVAFPGRRRGRRELCDAGGPILVAAAASVATLPGGLLALAGLLAAAGTAISRTSP
jgi:hypothetical protein